MLLVDAVVVVVLVVVVVVFAFDHACVAACTQHAYATPLRNHRRWHAHGSTDHVGGNAGHMGNNLKAVPLRGAKRLPLLPAATSPAQSRTTVT